MRYKSLEQLIRVYIFIEGLSIEEAVKRAKAEYEKEKYKKSY